MRDRITTDKLRTLEGQSVVWSLGIIVNMQDLLPAGVASSFVLRRDVAQEFHPFMGSLVYTFGCTSYHPL
jgi:hypothetical protein